MKLPIRKYIVILTLFLILVLLFIQVRWIIYSIQFQEKAFQKSVELALDKTITELYNNEQVSTMMQKCLNCESGKYKIQLDKNGIWERIRKAIDKELKLFEIDLEYDVHIIESEADRKKIIGDIKKGRYYSQCLGKVIKQTGYELVVLFPSRTKYFLMNSGLMFLSSILLIVLLMVSIGYLLILYKRELHLAQRTRDLIDNISHEFKTPLSSISLAANMIRKKRYSNEDKLKQYAEMIFKENKKLHRQVESLLHLAAIERNEFDYNKEEIDIHTVIEDAIETVEMFLAEKEGSIKLNFEASQPVVFADKMHLSNVFVNLLSNAIKYSKEKPEIIISTSSEEKKIAVRVKDKGIGISSKYVKFIFEKYYRVPTGNIHNIKGFGIGLSYVKRVVEAHSGKVETESVDGEGSTFKVELPICKLLNGK